MKTFVAVATVILALAAQAESKKKWDGLRVRWGVGLDPDNFQHQPRTVDEAKAQGWKVVGSDHCGDSDRYYGVAYTKDNDYHLTLLFDVNGFIAGIQSGITDKESIETGYPSGDIRPPFVNDGWENNRQIITAYFTEPSKICTTGRTQEDFDRDGDGEGLWIQRGEFAEDNVLVPELEKDIGGGMWIAGKCFVSMGKHYWYNLSSGEECNDFDPYFLLYNNGELNGFGWAYTADLKSEHFEHPGKEVFPLFMDTVPKCLNEIGTISTMHIFLTEAPVENRC